MIFDDIAIEDNMDIISRLAQYEYVSFDIFDTLIKRDVCKATDVFLLVQTTFFREYGIEIKNFQEQRMKAEKSARTKSGGREVTLEEIYGQLSVSELSVEQKNNLMQLEIDIEKVVCTANLVMKCVFEYCINNGKRVLIISDMYLPQNIIEDILQSNGFSNYEKLYLSSTIKKRKKDGGLFNYVLHDLGIEKKQLVHIGDNVVSDYESARRVGIKGILFKDKNKDIRNHKLSIEDGIIKAFVSNHMDLAKSQYYRFGYEKYGRLLLGFSNWLESELEKEGIEDVFFLSRDGHILKKAFDKKKNSKVRTHYLYVSRRSLRLPYLYGKLEYEAVIDSLPRKSWLHVTEFFENLGLNADDYTGYFQSLGISKDDYWNRKELIINEDAKSVFEKIKENVREVSASEQKAMIEYFETEKFGGKVAVVDIGWRGSLQYFIKQVFEKENIPLDIYGYYVGLDSNPRDPVRMKGFFNSSDPTRMGEDYSCYIGLIESIFVSMEGSVKKYSRDNKGKAVPLLYDYEYIVDKDSGFDQAACIKEIQEGGIAFVEDMKKTGMIDLLDIDAKLAFSEFNMVGNHPTMDDIKLFEKFVFLDVKKQPLIKQRRKMQYILRPDYFLTDLRESKWKIGFMKKTLPIPLPLYKLQKVLKNSL